LTRAVQTPLPLQEGAHQAPESHKNQNPSVAVSKLLFRLTARQRGKIRCPLRRTPEKSSRLRSPNKGQQRQRRKLARGHFTQAAQESAMLQPNQTKTSGTLTCRGI